MCNVLSKFDVIIIQETHFGVRVRCPKDFLFISRSQRVKSKVPRGGVAVYKNVQSDFDIDVICNDLRDCIIMKIRNTKLIIAAPYITPHNPLYYDNIYISNLELIFRKFQSYHLIVTGDMNARVGTPEYNNQFFTHAMNPDPVINVNGGELLDLLERWDKMVILNGLVYNEKNFDSKFTYYRGRLRSQNDTILSYTVEDIKEFHIMERVIFSDHCPTALTCKVTDVPSLMLIYKCSKDLFSYDHLYVNRRILQKQDFY